MKPLVSVVIASRNYGRYLGMALESVVMQTVRELDIIVVDDGSTDDTPQVVAPFLADARVRYFRTDGLGQPRAKNLGIAHARGEFIAFLDGDDSWLPTKLERQLPLFADERVGVVYTRRTLMNAVGEEQPTPQPPMMTGAVYDEMLVRNCVCFSSVVIRRSVLESVGQFNTQQALAIDYDLWLRIAKHYHFAYVDAALVKYRTGHGNLSQRIAERVHIVLSVLRRTLSRRRNDEQTPRDAQGEAWGSTCRTMAYVQRSHSMWSALRWYARAAWHDGHWRATLKSCAGVLCRGLRRRRA